MINSTLPNSDQISSENDTPVEFTLKAVQSSECSLHGHDVLAIEGHTEGDCGPG